MTLKQWISSAAFAVALCLAGCNATKARISDNEDLFNSYPLEVQALIKSNRIERGFDSTQVYLAFGNADRSESRDGQEIWTYHEQFTKTAKEEKTASEYRDELDAYQDALRRGQSYVAEPSAYRTFTLKRTAIERVVIFEDGRVVSWDEPEEAWVDDWHR